MTRTLIACLVFLTTLYGRAPEAAHGQYVETMLTAPAPGTHRLFGHALDISGSYLIATAYYDNEAHLYHDDGTGWAHVATLHFSRNPGSTALSGGHASVGESYPLDTHAHLFERWGVPGYWSSVGPLVSEPQWVGITVDLDGGYALIGTPKQPISTYDHAAGEALVFQRDPIQIGQWHQVATLTPTDGFVDDGFGRAVALDYPYAIVANNPYHISGCSGAGCPPIGTEAAYIFKAVGGTWSQVARLGLSDADGAVVNFGRSVAIGPNYALVGAPEQSSTGAAYLYERNGTTWGQNCSGSPVTCYEHRKLVPGNGKPGDAYGTSVALSGRLALVGAPDHGHSGFDQYGAAYLYERYTYAWFFKHLFTPSNPHPLGARPWYGFDVALMGDNALISAHFGDLNGTADAGVAFVYGGLRSIDDEAPPFVTGYTLNVDTTTVRLRDDIAIRKVTLAGGDGDPADVSPPPEYDEEDEAAKGSAAVTYYFDGGTDSVTVKVPTPAQGTPYTITVEDFAGRAVTVSTEALAKSKARPAAAGVPQAAALHPSYPNPFSAQTAIRLTLPEATAIRLAVYDGLGRRVRLLAAGVQAAGVHTVAWDGRDAAGRALPPGVYHYRLQAGAYVATRRVVLVN